MKFTFDGHDYQLKAGPVQSGLQYVVDAEGETVCTVTTDVADEYWIVEGDDRHEMQHVDDSTMLDVVKSFINATY